MSEQIVSFIKQRKKLTLVALIAIIVIIVSLIITINLTNKKGEKFETNENELTELLEHLSSTFYEEFFYIQAGKDNKSRKEFVEKYNETGITTTLDNIIKSVAEAEEKISEFKNNVTNEKCDKEQTIAKIIPKEPYGVKDYELEITLKCGF